MGKQDHRRCRVEERLAGQFDSDFDRRGNRQGDFESQGDRGASAFGCDHLRRRRLRGIHWCNTHKGCVELLYARQAVVVACAAFDLQPIDIVTIDYKDLEALKLESEFGARLGFSGKQVIHPNQVPVVQEAFTPSDEAVAYARRIVETFEASQKEGKGAYSLDGKMIDMPLLKNAQKVLGRARL
jgi:citrate lyase beta subunit